MDGSHSKENRILGKEEAWDSLSRGWPDGSVGTKSDDLSWTPRIDMVEEETHLLQVVPHVGHGTRTYANTHVISKEI